MSGDKTEGVPAESGSGFEHVARVGETIAEKVQGRVRGCCSRHGRNESADRSAEKHGGSLLCNSMGASRFTVMGEARFREEYLCEFGQQENAMLMKPRGSASALTRRPVPGM